MILIGINEGMNSSVTVLKDGEIIFAIQEERLNKIKEYSGFPEQALAFTMDYLGLKPADIEAVLLSNLKNWIRTREEFSATFETKADTPPNPGLCKRVLNKIKRMRAPPVATKKTPEQYLAEAGFTPEQIKRYEHHFLHAASAYYAVRKNHAEPHLVLTLDGGGDGCCSHVYKVEGDTFELLASTPSGNSVGNLYSAVTHYMGMKPHEHEYKLMGLAAYAKPEYCRPVMDIFKSYLDLDPENPMRFKHKTPERTGNINYRLNQDLKRTRFDNIAGGMQFYTEDLVVRWVKECVRRTGIKTVVAAGGVFMNVKANKIISEDEEIDYFDVMPSCGDETLPFGSVWYHYAKMNPEKSKDLRLKTFCLGPRADYDIKESQDKHDNGTLIFQKVDDPVKETARLMADGKIIARCAGPMEFGARALGNRSLLADAAVPGVIPFINDIIKKRDFWMPFAPAMLREDADQYIKIPHSLSDRVSPFMMHSFDTTERRDDFIAGVHAYDHTARAQTVDEEANPEFTAILKEFKKLSGKGVSLNTSFNLHGLPIVTGTEDAIHVLLNSGLEYLMVEDTLITKVAAENVLPAEEPQRKKAVAK